MPLETKIFNYQGIECSGDQGIGAYVGKHLYLREGRDFDCTLKGFFLGGGDLKSRTRRTLLGGGIRKFDPFFWGGGIGI